MSITDDYGPQEWAGTWEVSTDAAGELYCLARQTVVVRGPEARDRAAERTLTAVTTPLAADDADEDEERRWFRVEQVGDSLEAARELTEQGLEAQPEHVFFAHGCCSTPWWQSGRCDGARDGGFGADPLKANPLKANPLKANPLKANHPLDNTARPAAGRELPTHDGRGDRGVRILVLDSGLAERVPLLQTGSISGQLDRPDSFPGNGDGWLDPVAGHGTFIAGLIEQLAPGCTIEVLRVFASSGAVREGTVVQEINRASASQDPPHVLSLSFGGQVSQQWSQPLYEAVARARDHGIAVVASAGNDATSVPQLPASVPGVVAVGALDVDAPAWFTNYGSWVSACAPGVDLVSSFFAGFDGISPQVHGVDRDRFDLWARWSGTSFSGPVVVAAIAREIALGHSVAEAVYTVVEDPHLFRLPCLGTVVNI